MKTHTSFLIAAIILCLNGRVKNKGQHLLKNATPGIDIMCVYVYL